MRWNSVHWLRALLVSSGIFGKWIWGGKNETELACEHSKNFSTAAVHVTITATARSRACKVFARSNTGIVSSNPTQGIHVCVYSVLSSGLAMY
jgi:hypothetical protein